MAIRYAVNAGLWSDPATWDGGVSIPTTGDEVFSNNRRVTIDVALIDALYITNGSNVSPIIASGGGFNCDITTQIDAEIRWANASNIVNNILLNFNGTSSISPIINGTVTPGTVVATTAPIVYSSNPNINLTYNGGDLVRPSGNIVRYFLYMDIGGTLTVNSNAIQNTGASSAYMIFLRGDATQKPTLHFNGNLTQNSVSSVAAIIAQQIADVFIVGNATFNGNAPITTTTTSSTVPHEVSHIGNIVSNIGGGSVIQPWYNNGIAGWTCNWTGTFSRTAISGISTSASSGIYNWTTNVVGDNFGLAPISINIPSTNVTLNLFGNITGGNAQSCQGLALSAGTNYTLNIYGNVQGGNFNTGRPDLAACGLFCNIAANIDGDITLIGSDTSNSPGAFIYNTNSCFIQRAITGASPLFTGPYVGSVRFKTTAPEFQVSKQDNTVATLSDPALNDYPAESDVREGIEYGFLSYEGTLAVPLPTQVSLGIPVGGTVGQAILTPDDLFTAIENDPDPIAVRLRNVATVQTVGDQFNSFSS